MALLLLPPVARAEDVEAIVKKGIELRRHGHDREALEEFQRALALQRQPRILAQVALAEQAIGLWMKAERDLTEAMAAPDPWIEKNRPVLDGALRTVMSHLGSIEVWGSPAGAEVLINGDLVGTLPLPHPVRTTEEQVGLQVRAKGYVEINRVLHVPVGGTARENVELRAVPVLSAAGGAGATTAAGDDHPALSAAPSLARTHDAAAGDDGAGSPVYKKWWFWTVLGAVAIGAGAGIFLASRRDSGPGPCEPPSCSTWSN